MSDTATLALALGGTALAAYAVRRSVADAADARALAVRHMLDRDIPFAPSAPTAPSAPSAPTAPAVAAEPPPPVQESSGRPPLGRRVTRSTTDEHLRVIESPASLLAQARALVPDLTLDEYTAARLAASEHARGTLVELAAIVDAEVNRATRRRRSLFEHLTGGAQGTYGRQGRTPAGTRVASTRRDPHERHVRAALAVLRTGTMRGVSQGAERFFDPRAQLAQWNAGRSCHPLTILTRWSYGYPFQPGGGRDARGRRGCPLDTRRPGTRPLAWVGPIAGIDAVELMLFRPTPLGDEHTRRFHAARQLLEAYLRGRPIRPRVNA